jgi:hypothetical protein
MKTAHGAKGTFHEIWQIEWKPEFAVAVIEASLWGNTVIEAAVNKVDADAGKATELPVLTHLVEGALLADLADAIPTLMSRVQQVAATSAEIPHLMEALPPLANVLQYGNVRKTDTSLVSQVVDELVTRICIGLPSACSALDDEAAQAMFDHIKAMENAVQLLKNDAHKDAWARVLGRLTGQDGVHGLVRGRACRLIFECSEADELTAQYLSQALSPGTPAGNAAAWVEGFLHGSGQALIHHPRLWNLVNEWILSLPEDVFAKLLPLLRRTFSTFPAPERRQMGEFARLGKHVISTGLELELDQRRAEKALTLVIQILGNE